MIFSVLIPAAGSGERLGASVSKTLIEIGGEPMFVWAVKPFLRLADCQEVVIAAPERDLSEFEKQAKRLADPRVHVIPGGPTRQDSVGRALIALTKTSDAILVHDAARPFITESLIESVLNGLRNCSASLPGLPEKDTI
ncbi:2-C-methyl-D-erythritol 4-phosphate cytidylyltransferase, partial [bacterium]|nr:2-C-methyl-D-erythritol 4-phosphate cytidylyltransferase [bacterium]MBU1637642.1 2-C-methyl-D-erythritol 4-phosphate cytidylyltransferase [bacterium]